MTLRSILFFLVLTLGMLALGCGRGGRGSGATGIRLPPPGGGGGSGVAATRTIVSLTPDEIDRVCAYSVTLLGGERTVMCSDERSTTVSQAECETDMAMIPDTCTLTVGEYEGCATAVGPDPCMPGSGANEACAALIECVFMGTDGP